MSCAFGASDAQGAWVWKDAYEAAEAALIMFLQRYGRAMRREAGAGSFGPAAMLAMLQTLAALEPSQTRRSEEQLEYQQFSTPLPLAYAALQAAAIRPGDIVLEPSAGTGMLAVMAQCALGDRADGSLHLNEIAATRAGLLSRLFPDAPVTRHNAEAIADHLPYLAPTAVLMNPPFSASPGVNRIRHDADLRHIRSAFSMLAPGGRLAAITSRGCVPGDASWTRAFDRLDPPPRIVFSTAIDGRAYARRGTSFDTRLTVIDRLSPGDTHAGEPLRLDPQACASDASELLAAVSRECAAQVRQSPQCKLLPHRISRYRMRLYRVVICSAMRPHRRQRPHGRNRQYPPRPLRPGPRPLPRNPAIGARWPNSPTRLHRPTRKAPQANRRQAMPGLRALASPGSVVIAGAVAHPTPLVQSAAMAAVPHPVPSYRPILPVRVITEGVLSDAQFESVILAGEAHTRRLTTAYRIGEDWETIVPVRDGDGNGRTPRREL